MRGTAYAAGNEADFETHNDYRHLRYSGTTNIAEAASGRQDAFRNDKAANPHSNSIELYPQIIRPQSSSASDASGFFGRRFMW